MRPRYLKCIQVERTADQQHRLSIQTWQFDDEVGFRLIGPPKPIDDLATVRAALTECGLRPLTVADKMRTPRRPSPRHRVLETWE